jgi:hypothetical protein
MSEQRRCDCCHYPLEIEDECEHFTVWHCTGCAQMFTERKRSTGQRALELLREWPDAIKTKNVDQLFGWFFVDWWPRAKTLLKEAGDE